MNISKLKMPLAVTTMFWSALLQAELVIEDGYVRGLPPGQPVTAAFMQLRNTGEEAIVIASITSDSAEKVEIHQSIQQGDRVRMEQVAELSIAPGESIELAPNGYHLMLIDLTKPLRDGAQVQLQFLLSANEQKLVSLPVRSVLSENDHGHHHHH